MIDCEQEYGTAEHESFETCADCGERVHIDTAYYIEGVGYYSFRLSDNEVEALKNKSFTVNGTSFATPLSIAKNDTSLR